jgi:hypothetical protein
MGISGELRATRYLDTNLMHLQTKHALKKSVINVISHYVTIWMQITLIDIGIPINLREFESHWSIFGTLPHRNAIRKCNNLWKIINWFSSSNYLLLSLFLLSSQQSEQVIQVHYSTYVYPNVVRILWFRWTLFVKRMHTHNPLKTAEFVDVK